MIWGDLAARARGRAGHLVGDAALVEVEAARDRAGLIAALVRAGLPAAELGAAAAAAIEAVVRARAAADLAILERWAAERTDALAVVVDDEDRRSLRGLVRGLVAAAPRAARLDGAIATSRLPDPTLRALADAPTPAALAAALVACQHPAAPALAAVLATDPIDLIEVELALARWFAARASRSARVDHALAVHVAQIIDVENAGAALLLAARGRDLAAGAAFLPGGERMTRATFLAAAAAITPAVAATTLAAGFAGTPLAAGLASIAPDAIERAALAWHLATQGQLRRLEPLGLAPLLWLVLRRRAEARRLRRAAWRVELGGGP